MVLVITKPEKEQFGITFSNIHINFGAEVIFLLFQEFTCPHLYEIRSVARLEHQGVYIGVACVERGLLHLMSIGLSLPTDVISSAIYRSARFKR
jgi:hypothetical protein